jgi:radical SAM superfamily enzyme YgiQ (UPF0313 family)
MPLLPQKVRAPYIGQQYIASSLLKDGHEVRCLDLSAPRFSGRDEDAVVLAESWRPDMIGITLFTQNAARGYRLAEMLRHTTGLLIAGGPHPTVCPDESNSFGFNAVVRGEGEYAVIEYARWLDKNARIAPTRDRKGHTPEIGSLSQEPIKNLDDLPFPLESYSCFEVQAYSASGMVVPGGMITSRGCPSSCTFCANSVTGRTHRWRSSSNVVAEMIQLRETYGVTHFSFWDDAFTANSQRINDLCKAILCEPALNGITWSCITPANLVKPKVLTQMRKAGCVAINFGIESGDNNILKIIKKGQRPKQVKAVLAAAKAEGMTTILNFMFGFPEEGIKELERTLGLMADLSEQTDIFNNGGVLVPFPGTVIYNCNHEKYGFTRWWLDLNYVPAEPNLFDLDPKIAQKYLEYDSTLDLDFFRYSDEVRDKIAECVLFKAKHNQHFLSAFSGENA